MSNSKRILIVDDDQDLRLSLGEQLRLHEEFDTGEAETGAAAIIASVTFVASSPFAYHDT